MIPKALDMEKRFLILPAFQNHYLYEFLNFLFGENENTEKTNKMKMSKFDPMFKITQKNY